MKQGRKALESETEIEIELMKRTVNHILGTAVALAMTASGAFAQTVITKLPYTITQSGDYILQLPTGTQPLYGIGGATYPLPIWIQASNVNLDLNGTTVLCIGDGICIGVDPNNNGGVPVSDVSIKNGTFTSTFNANGAAIYYGLVNGVGNRSITVSNVNFTGLFGYNADYGSHSTFDTVTLSAFSINSQGQQDPGHGTYAGLILSASFAYGGNWALAVGLGGVNHFTNCEALSGNVVLFPTDLYKNFVVHTPFTLTGGIKQ